MNGWIKLHRQFLQWEWFSDSNVLSVFVYLLLQADRKDGKWRGHDILCGQHITSNEIISLHTGLSVQMVRTALRKLKSTGEITTVATNKFTLVTIVKWAFYQIGSDESNTQNNKQSTDTQHADNTQATIGQHSINNKQEVKEREKGKNVRRVKTPIPPTAVGEGLPTSLSQPVGFEESQPNNDEVNNDKANNNTARNIEPIQANKRTSVRDLTTIRNNYVFYGELEQAVDNWLTYKQEKRQPYKPSGLNSLLSQVQKHANIYGDDAVAHSINESMASNYQGIVWDKVKNIANTSTNTTTKRDSAKQSGNPFLAYARELEEQERGNL